MIKTMTVDQLKNEMEGDNPPILIDCRELNEWNEGHIEGATLMALSTLDQSIETLEDKKNRPLVLQCRSGKRSLRACQFLADNGFEDLTNLEGGILAWIEEGYPVNVPPLET